MKPRLPEKTVATYQIGKLLPVGTVRGFDLVTGMGVAFGKSLGGLYGIPIP